MQIHSVMEGSDRDGAEVGVTGTPGLRGEAGGAPSLPFRGPASICHLVESLAGF